MQASPERAPGGSENPSAGGDVSAAWPALAAEGAVPAREGEPLDTGAPDPSEVRVNETMRLQALDGIGVNAYAFPFVNDIGFNWSKVEGAFDELDIHYVRLASWFGFWEPENDNDDPAVTNWDAFDPRGIIGNHDVPFAKWLTERGMDVELGVWSTGRWLANGDPVRIRPSLYPELAESIVTYMQNMERNGVPQPIIEVQNEPGINAAIRYDSPEDLRDAALALLDRLDATGFEEVMLHGPNFHAPTSELPRWIEVWLENDRLRDRTAAVSYHSWWYENFENFDAVREVAERYGKPVWVTETGFCAIPAGCDNGHYLRPETWETAWDFAMSSYRALAWTFASRLYHWTLVGYDSAVEPGSGRRYPTFYALKHFSNYIEPGSRMLEVASGDPEVLAVAFLLPSGERTVILLNTSTSESKSVDLTSVSGLSTEVVEAVTTTRQASEQPTTVSGAGGAVRLSLPRQSMTSVRLSS